MKNFFLKFTLLTGIGAVVFASYLYFKRQINLALQYCYKLDNVDILETKTNSLALRLYLKIQNKSSIELKLKGYDLNFFINNKKVANVVSNDEQVIMNDSISTIKMLVMFNPSAIFKPEDLLLLLRYFVTDKSKIMIRIEGDFKAAINFLTIKLPVDFQMSLETIMSTSTEAEKQKTKCDI